MIRSPVNPWPWSLKLGFNQGEVLEGVQRQLVCAGQTAVDANGNPQHPGDMRKQFVLALDNLEAVLSAAGMGLAHITRLNVYTTDMDEALKHFDVLGSRMGPAAVAPPMTVLGVTRLAIPPLLIELEATAAS
ncbi:MAG: RidA family protein [Aestuariivirga sp.]|uniref:RidA family protein n=1 Tax=Aestuariivirga sp. TaxID=2650926 RepID=UPI0038D11B64